MILAKRMLLMYRNGDKTQYTHITRINADNGHLEVQGETVDVDGTPIAANDRFPIDSLTVMIVEFHKPRC